MPIYSHIQLWTHILKVHHWNDHTEESLDKDKINYVYDNSVNWEVFGSNISLVHYKHWSACQIMLKLVPTHAHHIFHPSVDNSL